MVYPSQEEEEQLTITVGVDYSSTITAEKAFINSKIASWANEKLGDISMDGVIDVQGFVTGHPILERVFGQDLEMEVVREEIETDVYSFCRVQYVSEERTVTWGELIIAS